MPAKRDHQRQDPLPDSYLTVAEAGSAELKVQRSRFIGLVGPADDENAARDFIQSAGRHFHDARHACYAWRLGFGSTLQEIRNDDGEPSGTAGEPILQALRKADLTHSVAVVIRYFGGIKLGTGRLSRAYGQTAQLALDATRTCTVKLGRRFELEFPYPHQKTITKLLAANGGHTVHETYGETVLWQIWLPHSTWSAFRQSLTEATAGMVKLVPFEQ